MNTLQLREELARANARSEALRVIVRTRGPWGHLRPTGLIAERELAGEDLEEWPPLANAFDGAERILRLGGEELLLSYETALDAEFAEYDHSMFATAFWNDDEFR